jgi:hypothetical protein
LDLPQGISDEVLLASEVTRLAVNEVLLCESSGSLPLSDVISVPERGWKSRTVTKSPWWLVTPAHHLRKWLLKALKRSPNVDHVLKGDHRGAIEELFKEQAPIHGWETVSSDLTSATDLLRHDMIDVMVNQLIASTKMPHWAASTLRLCTGP